jgi:hypothetical protein
MFYELKRISEQKQSLGCILNPTGELERVLTRPNWRITRCARPHWAQDGAGVGAAESHFVREEHLRKPWGAPSEKVIIALAKDRGVPGRLLYSFLK